MLMSSLLANLPDFTVTNLLHLLIIFGVAVFLNRLLRNTTKLVVKPAFTPSRAGQAREQQTRTLSDLIYSASSKIVWGLALLTAAQEISINILPIAVLAGLAALAVGLGAQHFVRDLIAGFYIIVEDQYVPGDTIQTGETFGRVEQLTLRRTVIRDSRGALVTVANGDIRAVGNLSRDWSQAFVDVAVSPLVPQEQALHALDIAATELRADTSWSQALVDGPRILGLQSYDQTASTIRLQVRTAPARQEDVARELRRRIQLEFQRQGIPLSDVHRVELVSPTATPENSQPASAA
jgi:small-conductance mechanosensitive channel